MRLYNYIERFVDFALIYTLFLGLNVWLPGAYAIGATFLALISFLFWSKKTPAMFLFKKEFSKKPTPLQLLKMLLGMGQDKTVQKPCSLRRRAGVLIVCALCTLGGIIGSAFNDFSAGFEQHHKNSGWEYYKSEDRGFTVQLPNSPSIETRQLYVEQADKTLNYNEYKSGSGNAYYSVSFMDFPSRWRIVGSTKLLNTAFDIFLKSEGDTELVSKESIYHKTYPAIEFVIKRGGKEMHGRLILVENTFYKVMRVSSSSGDDAQFNDFLSSFQFPKSSS